MALLTSCHGVNYTLSPSVTDEDAQEIIAAAETWNRVVKPDHQIHMGRGWRVEMGDPGDGHNGITHTGAHFIVIRTVPIRSSVYSVALHEFGHALGLEHTCALDSNPSDTLTPNRRPCDLNDPIGLGVMDPIRVASVFSAADIVECRRVGACL